MSETRKRDCRLLAVIFQQFYMYLLMHTVQIYLMLYCTTLRHSHCKYFDYTSIKQIVYCLHLLLLCLGAHAPKAYGSWFVCVCVCMCVCVCVCVCVSVCL